MDAVSLTTATEHERRTELDWRLLRLIPKVPRRGPIPTNLLVVLLLDPPDGTPTCWSCGVVVHPDRVRDRCRWCQEAVRLAVLHVREGVSAWT